MCQGGRGYKAVAVPTRRAIFQRFLLVLIRRPPLSPCIGYSGGVLPLPRA